MMQRAAAHCCAARARRPGLHVAALAVSLKVPVRKLEALEDDRWDLLPDAVFVRALASSVCRTLKIDPQPVLDRLPQTSKPRLVHDGEGINTPFRAPSDGAPPGWRDQLTRPVFLAVFALLLGALVIIFLPAAQQAGGVSAAALVDMGAPSPVSAVVVPPREEQVAVAPATSPAAASDSASAATPAPVAAAAASVSAAPSAVPASASAPWRRRRRCSLRHRRLSHPRAVLDRSDGRQGRGRRAQGARRPANPPMRRARCRCR